MKNTITYIFIGLFLFTNSACAEDAVAPVSKTPTGSETPSSAGGEKEEGHLELMALTYKGLDGDDNPCTLHISAVEEEEEEDNGEHHHELVAKVEYAIHGQTPVDTVVELQRYQASTKSYFPINSTEANTIPSMISILLKDKSIKVDYNKADQYEQNGQMSQFLRANFVDMDFEVFEEALEEVLEDESKFAANKAKLNQLTKTLLKLDDNGHTDKATCSDFTLVEMAEVEFEIGGENEHGHKH